jgi:hypothetical protein
MWNNLSQLILSNAFEKSIKTRARLALLVLLVSSMRHRSANVCCPTFLPFLNPV